ncbi:ankyrin [Dothidotthia symphoricarpi CBS 119687]|uniref:Ankyrin n=1 Tax=Dothidotthia symphoricarpi CBS 119687 TaxID=1392245 RepID=A0A6A6AAT4_9PLEO|nr:ankyrin [Dothidotthia symphoricarpi CBS 119687]KAF2128255.1 ankyrin [Dothidotthia symphoricarpi CBS 119687]
MTPELGKSLINMAAAADVDQMRTLLATGEESPSEETIQSLLTTAAGGSHLDVVNLLLTQYPTVSPNEEVVRAAVYTGSIPIFKALLARDSSLINMQFDRRGTPLIVACMSKQTVEYLRFLLEAGADPNQDPDAASFPLALVAAFYTDPAAIDLLLEHGARLERSGALSAASRRGNEPMIYYLLERGIRLDTDAPTMGTDALPLHVAVKSGHAGAARILLQHGADPDTTDASGATAFEVAK